jgi:hypothetical protein
VGLSTSPFCLCNAVNGAAACWKLPPIRYGAVALHQISAPDPCLHREDESEDDDSIVACTSEEEEEGADDGADGSSDEDGSEDQDGSDMESADSSESEEDFTIVPLASPRRTGRVRRVSSAAAGADLDSDGDGGSGGEREDASGQQAGAAAEPAGPEVDEEQERGGGSWGPAAGDPPSQQGPGSMPKPPRSCKSGGASQGGSAAKRKGLFMVVSEDTASTSALHLPQLKPVRPAAAAADGEGSPAAGGEEDAVCDVCGDGDAVEDNVILLCEGKGCRSGASRRQCPWTRMQVIPCHPLLLLPGSPFLPPLKRPALAPALPPLLLLLQRGGASAMLWRSPGA